MGAVGLAISPSFGPKPDNFASIAPLGMLIDPSSDGHRFKESTLVTPAVVGDTLGGLTSLTSQARHLIQATAANEPELVAWSVTDEGVYFVDSTDVLGGNAAMLDLGKGAPGLTVGLVLEPPSAFGVDGRIFNITNNGGNARFGILYNTLGQFSLQTRRVAADAPHSFGSVQSVVGVRCTLICSIDYATAAARIVMNGTTVETATATWVVGAACENLASSSITLGQGAGGLLPFTDGTIRIAVGYEQALGAVAEARFHSLLAAAGGL